MGFPDNRNEAVTSFVRSLMGEMHRRRVFRVAGAYAIVAWILMQLGEITFEPLQLPGWALTLLIIVLLLGFPLVMVLAWAFDWTADGIKRTQSNAEFGGFRTMILLVAVIGLDLLFGAYLYRIYAPSLRESDALTNATPSKALELPADAAQDNTIAVIPFSDLSELGDQGYFVQGVTEQLVHLLTQTDGLTVAGRVSPGERTATEIGELLNVATVLQGSVQRDSDSVRISVQLVDTASGFSRWSRQYERTLDDIFAVQDDIARHIVEELIGEVAVATLNPGPTDIPSSFAAYDLYLQGRELWRERTPASLNEAVDVFKRIIEMDPGFAPAYSGLADSYLLLANYGNFSQVEALRLAQPLIQTALELDGQLAEGFASLGLLYWNLGKPRAAEAHFRRAVSLDENNIMALMWLGSMIGQQGRLAEEQLVLEQAYSKDRLNVLVNINMIDNAIRRGDVDAAQAQLDDLLRVYPASGMVLRTAAQWHLHRAEFEKAFDYVSQILLVGPDEPTNRAMVGAMLLDLGATAEAEDSIEKAVEVGERNDFVFHTHLRYLTMTGRLDQVRSLVRARLENLGDMITPSKAFLGPYIWLARVDLLEGNTNEAIGWLDRAVEYVDDLPPLFAAEVLTLSAAAHGFGGASERASEFVGRAERLIRQVRIQGANMAEVDYLEACVAALRGDPPEALDHLREARAHGWIPVWEIETDPRLTSLKGDPGFGEWIGSLKSDSDAAFAQVRDQIALLEPPQVERYAGR